MRHDSHIPSLRASFPEIALLQMTVCNRGRHSSSQSALRYVLTTRVYPRCHIPSFLSPIQKQNECLHVINPWVNPDPQHHTPHTTTPLHNRPFSPGRSVFMNMRSLRGCLKQPASQPARGVSGFLQTGPLYCAVYMNSGLCFICGA